MLTEEKRDLLLGLSTPLAVDAMDRLGLRESEALASAGGMP